MVRRRRYGLRDNGNGDGNGDDGDSGPAPEDYTLTPCGPLGSKTCVGQVEGRFVGQFKNDREAARALCVKMEREQFWPGVWSVSDHGNVSPFRLRCPSPRRKR